MPLKHQLKGLLAYADNTITDENGLFLLADLVPD